ncbi:MAG: Uma2 family endonuclease [Cyanobacteria bacterium P01_A01_bin.17]
MNTVTLTLEPLAQLTDQQFLNLCHANPEAKLERTATGELVVMSPTGGESGRRNRRLTQQLGNWTDQDSTGESFDSSTMFRLPNGAFRSPDAAWIPLDKWNALTPEERRTFPPLCPDFVIELRSPSDALTPLQDKMQEYIDNGTRLGWLLNPQDQEVEIFRRGRPKEVLSLPTRLEGESVLPDFVLVLQSIL